MRHIFIKSNYLNQILKAQINTDWSESILLIDRYKYLDLLPCGQSELKAIGYKDIPIKQATSLSQTSNFAFINYLLYSNFNKNQLSKAMLSNLNLNSSDYENSAMNELKKAKYPNPDITQMLPFKPVRNACKNIINIEY